MKRTFFVACLALAVSVAARAQNCVVSLSYSPQNPTVNETITISGVVAAPASTSQLDPELGLTAGATVNYPGLGEQQILDPQNDLVVPAGGSTAFTFPIVVPYPGTVAVRVLVNAMSGSDPSCAYGEASLPAFQVNAGGASGTYGNLLAGRYAFRLDGFVLTATAGTAGSGTLGRAEILGSFAADGAGNVTGVLDTNSALGSSTAVPFTGTYAINGATGGTLTISTPVLGQMNFAVSVASAELQGSEAITHLALQMSSQTGFYGNGTAVQQAQMPAALTNATISLEGESPCSAANGCAPVPAFVTGVLVPGLPGAQNGTVTFSGDVNGSVLGSETAGLTVSSVDPTTGNFTFAVAMPQSLLEFTGYFIDANHFWTMATDSHAGAYLLYGSGVQ